MNNSNSFVKTLKRHLIIEPSPGFKTNLKYFVKNFRMTPESRNDIRYPRSQDHTLYHGRDLVHDEKNFF